MSSNGWGAGPLPDSLLPASLKGMGLLPAPCSPTSPDDGWAHSLAPHSLGGRLGLLPPTHSLCWGSSKGMEAHREAVAGAASGRRRRDPRPQLDCRTGVSLACPRSAPPVLLKNGKETSASKKTFQGGSAPSKPPAPLPQAPQKLCKTLSGIGVIQPPAPSSLLDRPFLEAEKLLVGRRAFSSNGFNKCTARGPTRCSGSWVAFCRDPLRC